MLDQLAACSERVGSVDSRRNTFSSGALTNCTVIFINSSLLTLLLWEVITGLQREERHPLVGRIVSDSLVCTVEQCNKYVQEDNHHNEGIQVVLVTININIASIVNDVPKLFQMAEQILQIQKNPAIA